MTSESWRDNWWWLNVVEQESRNRQHVAKGYTPFGGIPGVLAMSDSEFESMTPWDYLEASIAAYGRLEHLRDLSPSRQFSSIQRNALWIEMTGDPMFIHLYGARTGCESIDWEERAQGDHHERTARLGDDGRWHLIDPKADRCVGVYTLSPDHSQWCLVVTGGKSEYRTGTSWHPDDGEVGEHYDVTWPVTYIGDSIAPCDVPKYLRCPTVSQAEWPRPASSTRVGAMRTDLIEQFGPRCMICHLRFATVIDHDHLTDRVRGLLCHECNLWVDGCDDIDGCWRADYLNSPPLAHLNLIYPNATATRRQAGFRRTVAVIEAYDAFAHLRSSLPPKPRTRKAKA